MIRIDATRVRKALARYASNLHPSNRARLMQILGLGQLRSIYKTFAEEGSPAGSWPALAQSTIKRMKGKAAGHKLLIGRGTLRNSIRVQSDETRAIIGTGLIYAPVHQFGSRDRGVGIGPKTEKEAGATVKVKAHSYTLHPHLEGRQRSLRLEGPALEGKRAPRMRYTLTGPRNLSRQTLKEGGRREALKVNVGAHHRHQNIPPRPFLVFRPEDPQRIETEVRIWNEQQAASAGLEVK